MLGAAVRPARHPPFFLPPTEQPLSLQKVTAAALRLLRLGKRYRAAGELEGGKARLEWNLARQRSGCSACAVENTPLPSFPVVDRRKTWYPKLS